MFANRPSRHRADAPQPSPRHAGYRSASRIATSRSGGPSPVPIVRNASTPAADARSSSPPRRRETAGGPDGNGNRPACHFNRAPTGTSSRNPASTGFPPSSEAATIIPLDSMPRILRGCQIRHNHHFPPHQLFRLDRPARCPPEWCAVPARRCRSSDAAVCRRLSPARPRAPGRRADPPW